MTLRFFNFRHLKSKLVTAYLLIFFIVMVLSVLFTYTTIKRSILKQVDESLTMQIGLIKNSIESSTDASIKNFFRATAYSMRDAINVCYEKYRSGELTEAEAKELALNLLEGQKLGPSGYMTIISKDGLLVYHPVEQLIGTNINEVSFIDTIFENDEIFFTYQWQNPEDDTFKDKAMYSLHYQPWDWYITATGYKQEFMSLVTISDFEDKVLAIRFGETGYPLVLDMEGTFLIHPTYKGVNMYDRNDSMGEVTRKAIQEKNGKTEYYWRNPGETNYRKKLTLYSEIPEFGMIVAATAYESEFLKPLEELKMVLLLTLIGSLFVIGFLTMKISQSITRPIVDIKRKMDMAALGNMDIRVNVSSQDEIGEIGNHFNHFIETLQNKQEELKEQLQMNSDIANELRASLFELQITQQRLIEEERFSNMGRLVTKVSHQLNTPIGTAVTAVSFIEKETVLFVSALEKNKPHKSIFDEHIETVVEAITVLKKALGHAVVILESFKKLDVSMYSDNYEEVDVHEFLTTHYYKMWRYKVPSNIHISFQCQNEIRFKTIPEVLSLVLDNLTANSLAHGFTCTQEGFISVQASLKDTYLELVYSDNGRGISIDDANRVFEPFFSSTHHMGSPGLGLNIIYNAVVGNLKGSIHYEGNTGTGVRFVIRLPQLD